MKKSFLNKMISASLISGITCSVCSPAFANFGYYYSYRLFKNENWHTEYNPNYWNCPREIIDFIESDDIDGLVRILAENSDINPKDLYITSTQVPYSDVYKCFLCFGNGDSYDVEEKMSLLDYAFSCGSIKCSKYLVMNDVKSFSENNDFLMLYAIVSGNFELIHLAEQMGASVTLNSFYLAARMLYTGNAQERAMILKWVAEHGVIENLGYDEAEKALAFLILAENACSDEEVVKKSLSDLEVKNIVEQLINSCCKEGFSQNLVATLAAAPVTNLPLYSELKDKFKEYISSKSQGYINQLKRNIISEFKYFCNDYYKAEVFNLFIDVLY